MMTMSLLVISYVIPEQYCIPVHDMACSSVSSHTLTGIGSVVGVIVARLASGGIMTEDIHGDAS